MGRTQLQGHDNNLKRVLVYVRGFNQSLVIGKFPGAGTPRGLSWFAAQIWDK